MSRYQSNSSYCYEGTDILINKFNIRNQAKLDELEKLYTMLRLAQLSEREPLNEFSSHSFKEIHRIIFGDIYSFAGEFRTEGISKGTSFFAHPSFINEEAERIFNELNEEHLLKGLPVEKFAHRLSYFLSELNALHPFREGNGRTIRELARQIALKSHYELDWSKASSKETIEAFIQSFHGKLYHLSSLIFRCIC